jgi:hypothetical protein
MTQDSYGQKMARWSRWINSTSQCALPEGGHVTFGPGVVPEGNADTRW